MDLPELRGKLTEIAPEKTIVDINDIEDENHVSYKVKCEQLQTQIEALKEAEQSRDEMVPVEKVKSLFGELLPLLKRICDTDAGNIQITDENGNVAIKPEAVSADTSISAPAVYAGQRPSWFTPLRTELTKAERGKELAKKTQKELRPLFTPQSDRYDRDRTEKVKHILESNVTNEEKYIRYMMITSGIDDELKKALNGAIDLGIDADIAIRFLEQPAETFNREVFEDYVSNVHKTADVKLKSELADDLIRGKWYVSSRLGGKSVKYQMVPCDMVDDTRRLVQELIDILSGRNVSVEKPPEGEPAAETEKTVPAEKEESDDEPNFEDEVPDFDGML